MIDLDLEKPPLEPSPRISGQPSDLDVPEIVLGIEEQDELQRARLTALTAWMVRGATSKLAEEREALTEATKIVQCITPHTTIGQAALIKERYRIVRSKYLAKRSRLQKSIEEQYADLLARIAEHGISDDLMMVIITQESEAAIVRQMIAGKLLDRPAFPRRTFRLRGDKTCPYCKLTVSEGCSAVFDDGDKIAHPNCYGAALVLRRAGGAQ